MTVNLKAYVKDPACIPTRAHATDAGIDLYTRTDETIYPDYPHALPLGVHVAIPEGHVGLLTERSSTHRHSISLVNKIGIIDPDYRGELIAKVTATGDRTAHIDAHTKLFQLVIVPIITPAVEIVDTQERLGATERGEGGFGSTNKENK